MKFNHINPNNNNRMAKAPVCSPLQKEQGAITRRQFLGSTGALLAAAGAGRALAETAANLKPAAKKVVVGGNPWVYAAPLPNNDINPILPAIFEDFSYAGLDGIELMPVTLHPPDAVERIEELSRKNHLLIIGSSYQGAMWDRARHQAILDDANIVIPRLGKLGGRTLGTSVGAAPTRKTEAQLDAQAELLRQLIALCQKYGIVLNLHNHTYEVRDNLHDLKGTLSRIPDVKLGPDLNWLVRAGVDPAWFIRQYGKQIVFMHLRDQKKNGRWSEALGEGDTDFAAISLALCDIGFQGDAVIELAHEADFQKTRPLRESLKISREFVRSKLGY